MNFGPLFREAQIFLLCSEPIEARPYTARYSSLTLLIGRLKRHLLQLYLEILSWGPRLTLNTVSPENRPVKQKLQVIEVLNS